MANDNADKINCSNVINLKDLKSYLRNFDNGVCLSVEEMDMIYNKLLAASSGMTNEEHVQNIKRTQRELGENICPRCGSKLVIRTSKDGSRFYGCSNYPKCKFTKRIK